MSEQAEVTFALSADGGDNGKWAAVTVESYNLDADDCAILEQLTGYGDTPLAAMAALLDRAMAAKRKRTMRDK